eukprot:TRINITY_DN1038_c1_g6_i1.p1 TRINITY_DN1038_c1_g6~~TRINITY_DN1038_c1_g6_i1.p1  ORF type:complete len:164 (+),score=37.11 TRINITY_DN1038_c1_g6_i1:68-559(+)
MTVENTNLIAGDVNTLQQQQSQQPFALYGVPEQQATTVVVNGGEEDDFVPACLGTACCGIVGLCCFGCFCNTPTGRVGASTGCIFYGFIMFATYLTLLLLYKKDDCEDSSASGTVCDSMLAQSMGRLIASVVVAAVIFVFAIILRIKFVKDLNNSKPAVHIAL